MFQEIGRHLDSILMIVFCSIALFYPSVLIKSGSPDEDRRRVLMRRLGMIGFPIAILLAIFD